MKDRQTTVKIINDHGPMGFVFFVAYIGACVYFVQQAQGFWAVVGAFIKALVWPGFVLYYVLQLLGV